MNQKLPFYKKIAFKSSVVLAILVFIFASLSIYFTIKNTQLVLNNSLIQNRIVALDEIQFLIEDFFKIGKQDVLILSKSPNLQELIKNPYNTVAKNNLQQEFVNLSEQRQHYNQIRFIDINGDEIIRVDNKNNKVNIVPQANLQNKKDRYYFTDTLVLDNNELYISNIDLNKEGSPPVIEYPLNPVSRIGTPLYVDNELKGIIIINVSVADLLSEIKKYSSVGNLSIIDENGYYLLNNDQSKLWGGENNLNTQASLNKDNAQLFNDIKSNIKDNSTINDISYIYTTLTYDDSDNSKTLAVFEEVSSNIIFFVTNVLIVKLVFITFSAAILMLFFAVFFIKKLTKPVENMANTLDKISYTNTTTRVKQDKTDEIGILGKSINKLLDRLQNYQMHLQDEVNIKTQNLNKFKLAVESTSEGVLIIDKQGIILFANKSVENLTGYINSEIIGTLVGKLWWVDNSKTFYDELWNSFKENNNTFQSNIISKTKTNETYITNTTINSIKTNEKIDYYVVTEKDITDDIKAQQELEKQRTSFKQIATRYKFAMESAKMGVWEWDIINNVLKWDELMYQIYGIKPENFGGAYETWQNGLYSEDKEQAEKELQLALKGKKDFNTTFRITWPDNSIHYIRAYGLVERNKEGNPIKMTGINWDVSKEASVDKMKTDFISLASHQLRTPLSAIKWFIELLLSKETGKLNKQQKEFINNIETSNERMIDLVNMLLNISRIESGRIIIDPSPTDIKTILNTILLEYDKKIKAKKINVIKSISDTIPNINIDTKLIGEVFSNLIGNAVKYNKVGGDLIIIISKTNTDLMIQISDTGIGIPDDSKSKLFDRFYRASNAIKTDTEGNGLGLYLVKAIIESSQGKIWFESEENKGTSFWFSLPLKGMDKKEGEVSISKTKGYN